VEKIGIKRKSTYSASKIPVTTAVSYHPLLCVLTLNVLVWELPLNMNSITQDKELYSFIKKEEKRQREVINLVASENYASKAVRQVQASVLTNKYAEGYPWKRYYGGTKYIDDIEQLAIDRCLKLFVPAAKIKNWHANVQPYSGTSPNLAVYFAVLKPLETALAMDLAAGGHLSHGSKLSISGKIFNFVHYGVSRQLQLIDFEEVRALAKKYRPKLIVAGASAYPRIIDFKKFREITNETGSLLLIDMAHIAGLVAAEAHPSPIPFADFVTSSTQKTLRGPRGGFILCKKEFAPSLDKALFPGLQGGPLEHIIAAKAVCFKEAATSEFKNYIREVLKNAKVLAEMLKKEGFKLTSGGTDNHLLNIDFGSGGPNGKEVEEALEEVGIIVNREVVPGDIRPPFIASGIRVGTPAVTTRGMKEKEMKTIASWLSLLIKNLNNKKISEEISKRVKILTKKFPVA